jgi:hypothetical protein
MSFEECTKQSLWPILVETVHAMILYPNHKAYTRDVVLNEKPDIKPDELVSKLKISLGEALVILFELGQERKLKT